MTLLLETNDRLLFIGDSITDAGRTSVSNPGDADLGGGYVGFVDGLLKATYPEKKITVLNRGIGGHTVRDLAKRWQKDVIDQEPNWLTIMIGTNDVWRQFDTYNPADAVPPGEFVNTYVHLIERAKPVVKGLILLTPFYITTDLSEPIRKRMDEYVLLVKEIGETHGLTVLDTQAAYDKALKSLPYQTLAEDHVHPTVAGHVILAKLVLGSLGFSWEG